MDNKVCNEQRNEIVGVKLQRSGATFLTIKRHEQKTDIKL